MANRRIAVLFFVYLFWSLAIVSRLYYWQVIAKNNFSFALEKQLTVTKKLVGERGEIESADGYPLVLNQDKYLVYAWLPALKESFGQVLNDLKPIIFEGEDKDKTEEKIKILQSNYEKNKQRNWFSIHAHLSKEQKEKIKWLNIAGIGFETQPKRFYPEASMAASLLGFVGLDEMGKPKGYFGLEGFYQRQLSGMAGLEKSSHGILKWLEKKEENKQPKNGRKLKIFIDRYVQFIAEEELEKGIKKYGAKSGWVLILDAKEGSVIAAANQPKYNPETYYRYQYKSFINPLISATFEPGSIFKPLVMAAAIEEKALDPQTRCDICQGPLKIGKYEIKTWNDVYHPDSTMTEVIKNSDNVGMVFAIRKLGLNKFLNYLQKFNLDRKTGIDLEGESVSPLKNKRDWHPIDLATASFGQGIALTPIQIATAFNSLANGGKIIQPRVVSEIIGQKASQKTRRRVISRPISKQTADKITAMMITAVEEGEAKWTKSKNYLVAGKTGTAQIATRGKYDKTKTIASFIGFAPAKSPRFTMLVSLKEPASSPWGAETAAPLWFSIANRLFQYWGIPPDKSGYKN